MECEKVIGVLKIGENKTDVVLQLEPDIVNVDELLPHFLVCGDTLISVDHGVEEGVRAIILLESLKELYKKIELLEGGPKYMNLTFNDLGSPSPICISQDGRFAIEWVSDFFKVSLSENCFIDSPYLVRKLLSEFAQQEFDIEFIPSDPTFHFGDITGKEGYPIMDHIVFSSIHAEKLKSIFTRDE